MTDWRESEPLLSILLSTSLASMAVSSLQLANGFWSDGDREEKSDSEEEEDDGVSEGEKRDDEEDEGWMAEVEKRLAVGGMAVCKESDEVNGSADWRGDGSGSKLRWLKKSFCAESLRAGGLCCCWCAFVTASVTKSVTGTERMSVPMLCGERGEEPCTVRSRMPSVELREDWGRKEENTGLT